MQKEVLLFPEQGVDFGKLPVFTPSAAMLPSLPKDSSPVRCSAHSCLECHIPCSEMKEIQAQRVKDSVGDRSVGFELALVRGELFTDGDGAGEESLPRTANAEFSEENTKKLVSGESQPLAGSVDAKDVLACATALWDSRICMQGYIAPYVDGLSIWVQQFSHALESGEPLPPLAIGHISRDAIYCAVEEPYRYLGCRRISESQKSDDVVLSLTTISSQILSLRDIASDVAVAKAMQDFSQAVYMIMLMYIHMATN